MPRPLPIRFVLEVFREFTRDGCDALAGTLAFFTLFSLPPLLALIVDLASWVVTPGRALEELQGVVTDLSGPEVARELDGILEQSHFVAGESVAARVVGILLLVFTSTIILAQAQRALNHVWAVTPQRGFQQFLLRRAISVGLVVGFVAVLLVSVAAGSVLSSLGSQLDLFLPAHVRVSTVRVVAELLGFAMLVLTTTAVHHFLPDVRLPKADLWIGGVVTAFLLQAGQVVIVIVSTANMGSVYGAAQSLALLLFWVFYASALFLWGAEFIKVLARWRGHEIVPVKGAKWTPRHEQA